MRTHLRVALAVLLCAPTVAATATQRHYEEGALDVVVAGDLDHDRVADFVWHEGGAATTTVVAISGRTGRTLWTKEVPVPDGVAVPRRVGANGAPGVLVTGAVDVRLSVVHALDATGSLLWTRPVAAPPDNVTYVGPIDVAPGGGNDLLFKHTRGKTWALTVVDGTDGTARDVVGPVSSGSYDDVVTVLGDLDRDHRDDVAVMSVELSEDTTLTLWSGTGQDLWSGAVPSSKDGPRGLRVQPVGDLDGDGVTDVGVDAPDTHTDPQRGRPSVSVFAGRTGRVLWSRPGTLILPLANRGNVPRVAIATDLHNAYYSGYDVSGYDARGRSAWHVHRLVRVNDGPFAELSAVTDVDRDGVGDVGLTFAMRPNLFDSAVIDGRTGRVRRDPAAALDMVGALDGSGADRLAWGGTRVTAWQGDGARRLWDVTYDWDPGLSGRWMVADLNGDKCADLVVNAPYSSSTFAIDGADGEPLWAWDDSGTPYLPKVTSRHQYARTC